MDPRKELYKIRDKDQAKNLARFFKTGKGQYGEGDIFWGIKVPKQRKIAKQSKDVLIKEVESLVRDKVHECRLTGLLILIEKYKKADLKEKEKIFNFYIKNSKYINNWDLVDLSAPQIVGNFLLDKDKDILYKLSKSKNLWEKRISIISTFAFIRNKDFKETINISEILLKDEHDLIQKAVGWMLREMGKRDKQIEVDFLNKHYKEMPRTMLRYAIEKFNEKERNFYLDRI
jgi:3-methyladenine DNA glycosylase AlkD